MEDVVKEKDVIKPAVVEEIIEHIDAEVTRAVANAPVFAAGDLEEDRYDQYPPEHAVITQSLVVKQICNGAPDKPFQPDAQLRLGLGASKQREYGFFHGYDRDVDGGPCDDTGNITGADS